MGKNFCAEIDKRCFELLAHAMIIKPNRHVEFVIRKDNKNNSKPDAMEECTSASWLWN